MTRNDVIGLFTNASKLEGQKIEKIQSRKHESWKARKKKGMAK
jgi:hypothetical protein